MYCECIEQHRDSIDEEESKHIKHAEARLFDIRDGRKHRRQRAVPATTVLFRQARTLPDWSAHRGDTRTTSEVSDESFRRGLVIGNQNKDQS